MRQGWTIAMTLAASLPLFGATVTVDLNGGADYTDIQSAIWTVVDGDTVLVKPGEYVITQPITCGGKAITVQSEGGPAVTRIAASRSASLTSVVSFVNGETSASRLKGFTITGGDGVGILCEWHPAGASPTLTNCTISHNVNGGVLCLKSSPTLISCTISGNEACGVFCHFGSSPTLTDCTISGNTASLGGGVSCSGGSFPTLTNCTISGNRASSGAGGVYCPAGASSTLTSCIVWDNVGGSVEGAAVITHSCIEGESVWPGEGNINQDPLFCGGWGQREVWVDPSRPAPGDGSKANPFSDPHQATLGYSFSLALSAGSPCWGRGEGGSDMGSDTGRCEVPAEASRIVHLAPGMYKAEDFALVHRVSLLGAGEDRTVIEGTVKYLRTGSLISNLTITKGTNGGIAIAFGESPEITNCAISGNSASYGGGVSCAGGSSPTLTNCTISGNSAFKGAGGVYCENSSPTLTNCIVWDNVGGSVEGAAVITYSCIEGEPIWPGEGNINQDPLFCGGWGRREVWVDSSWPAPGDGSEANPFSDPRQATLGYSFSSALSADSPCWARGEGGSDMGADTGRCETPAEASRVVHLAQGTYKAEDFDLVHRVSLLGAGEDKTVIEGTVEELRTGSSISNLTITKGGIGIWIRFGEGPEITNCTISGNSGSGVYCPGGSPKLTNCRIWGNTQSCAVACGGGVYCKDSFATLTNCTICENSVSSGGGGVYCENSSPTLTNCTISGNETHGTGLAGLDGAVYCAGGSSPTLANCTISGNYAGYAGGGISCDNSSPRLINCTVSGNDSVGPWGGRGGAGVLCMNYSSPTLTNCTISARTAYPVGAGVICQDSSSATLTNCIVWDCPYGAFLHDDSSTLAITYSCIEGDDVPPGEGNTNRDPLLVRLGRWEECAGPGQADWCVEYWDPEAGQTAWGRWVFDFHIKPGSPCIDAGTTAGAPTTDIEGNGRPCGARVDIGAYELGNCPADFSKFRRGDANSDNKLNIADAVHTLSYLFGHGAAASCLDTADANDDGSVNIADAIKTLGHLFASGGPLPAPFGSCGIDPTIDNLDCVGYTPCN